VGEGEEGGGDCRSIGEVNTMMRQGGDAAADATGGGGAGLGGCRSNVGGGCF
jgi:hypothetical protein